jgi:hypothetical protein
VTRLVGWKACPTLCSAHSALAASRHCGRPAGSLPHVSSCASSRLRLAGWKACPVPKPYLLVLCGSATLRENRARAPIPCFPPFATLRLCVKFFLFLGLSCDRHLLLSARRLRAQFPRATSLEDHYSMPFRFSVTSLVIVVLALSGCGGATAPGEHHPIVEPLSPAQDGDPVESTGGSSWRRRRGRPSRCSFSQALSRALCVLFSRTSQHG